MAEKGLTNYVVVGTVATTHPATHPSTGYYYRVSAKYSTVQRFQINMSSILVDQNGEIYAVSRTTPEYVVVGPN